ncbi:RDD family protein [Halovenus salina]|uniref:RDD family protein n=1 Tax=Halovenus salina TaxID=1510225 RepID=A0ABD5W0S2_9EURY
MVKPAPLHTRTPAFLCDQAIVSVLGVVPTVAAGVPVAEVVSPGPTRRGVFVLLMGVAFIYHFILEWQTGTTVGKRLFGLGVRRDDGHEIGVVASFVRNALRLVDGLGYWGSRSLSSFSGATGSDSAIWSAGRSSCRSIKCCPAPCGFVAPRVSHRLVRDVVSETADGFGGPRVRYDDSQ